MRQYIHRTRIQAPLEAVSHFYKDSRALRVLTPPPMFVQLHEVEPLGDGSRTKFTMWLGPLPVHWVAVHSDVDTLRGFTDSQDSGPFKYWVHRHSFEPVSLDVTDVVDDIQAELGQHPFWGLVSRFMWVSLPLLFAYRAWVMKRTICK